MAPKKKEILLKTIKEVDNFQSTEQAISNAVFNRRFGRLEADLKEQKKLIVNVIIGVLIATFLTVFIVAVEVIHFHNRDSHDFVELQKLFLIESRDLRELIYKKRH